MLGSMDLAEYHSCSAVVESCLAQIGVEASFFSDWLVPPDQHRAVLRCLACRDHEMPDLGRRALSAFIGIVRGAGGSTLLAVCD